MEDLYSIKKKLENFKKIKQITDAIRLVSITTYSQVSKRLAFLKKYLEKMEECLPIQAKQLFNTLIRKKQERSNAAKKNILLIIIGSSKEFGSDFSNKLKKFISKKISAGLPTSDSDMSSRIISDKNIEAIVIAKNHEKVLQPSKNISIIKNYINFSFKDAERLSHELCQDVMNRLENTEEVIIFNNKFRNFFIQNQIQTTLIKDNRIAPFEEQLLEQDDLSSSYEKMSETITILFKKYLRAQILYHITNSLTSENASRFMAMEKSSQNAEELISELTLKANKIRQMNITRQISELTTAFKY